MQRLFPFLLFLLLLGPLSAQVITVDPIFPRETDTVTITFDATQGNGALAGFVPVYAHTGVITSASSSPTDWRHVQGTWGTADPNVAMTPLGNNKHEIRYHIPTFYNVPGGETVQRLAFVFRDAGGNNVGREFDGSDIFYPVYGPGLFTRFVTPANPPLIANVGDTIAVFGAASDNCTLTLTDNGTQIATASATTTLNHDLLVQTSGSHEVILTADDGVTTVRDTFLYVVNPGPANVDPPSGTELGITYVNDSTVRLRLFAPQKSYVYVIGSFNNWNPDPAYYMNKSLDQNTYWIDLTLTPGSVHTFQYLVDGVIRVADPYSEVVLDDYNDGFIPSSTYPNLPAYPAGASGIVTLLEPGKPDYQWQNPTYSVPNETDLVVYELLLRDFLAAHDYPTLLDTLDYLEDLGVNAIELMPVNEFEGNESWGYNPSFHMALDKYYGTEDDFKAFIDECHARGIAVILDVVYNHAFSQSPLCRLYWDDNAFKPTPDNPWLNPDPRHDFNVGYDFNHESSATQDWLDRVMLYWINDFKIDGFRFDLSKGFTQNYTVGNIGAWGAYDASRVALLQRLKGVCQSANPDFYLILEHFADNSEETALANDGFMLWGNVNHAYSEGTMGYIQNSDISWGSYQQRGWNNPKLVTFMESHDEERLMFKNLEYGNSNGGYDIRDMTTALQREELAGALFFTIPGPKMIWQFGELGYDFSIDYDCRVCNKPIRWDYYTDMDRLRLYKVWAAMIKLKTSYSTFRTTNYQIDFGGGVKFIRLNDNTMNAIVIGNFDVSQHSASPNFQQTGWWYDYMTGDSIYINNTGDAVNLAAGEYHIYTDRKLPVPDLNVITEVEEPVQENTNFQAWPNPSSEAVKVEYSLSRAGAVELVVYDLMGREVKKLVEENQIPGTHSVEWDGNDRNGTRVSAGAYYLRLTGPDGKFSRKLVRMN